MTFLKSKISILVVLIIFTITSCTKEPSASFSASKTNAKAGESITFSNTSKDATTYEWSFGDGDRSTLQSPTKVYNQIGTFNVILTTYSNNLKKKATSSSSITITSPCLNGGDYISGNCVCPTGYTGSDCGVEKPLVSMTISKIIVTKYPMTSTNGGGWDNSNGPDIFLSINAGSSANNQAFGGTFEDATGQGLSYTTNFPVTFTSVSSNYSIGLWDYDTLTPNELMGGFYFAPNDYKSGFPSTITLYDNKTSMTLYVTWNF